MDSSVLASTEGPELVDGSFISRDGLALSTWRIHGDARGLPPLILLHGLADHSRSMPYVSLGRALAAHGFEVFAVDRRGSGRSAGTPNYASDWSELRDDLARFVDIVEDQCGRLPALVGLSLGGLQALDFAMAAPESLHSCVALAPALDVSGSSRWLRRLLPHLAEWLPRIQLDPGLDVSALTRDPALCLAYRTDPLWRAKVTPALAMAVLRAIDRVRAEARHLSSPLLVFHGTADRVVPILGTRETFPRFGSKDKTLHEYPGAFHALPLEPEGEAMAAAIAAWLRARAGSRALAAP